MVKIKQVSNAYKEIRKRIALQNQTFFLRNKHTYKKRIGKGKG